MRHRIHGSGCCIVALNNSDIAFGADMSGYISVFSHSDVCTGVTIEGLKYELHDASLTNTFTLGVSNEFIGAESRIRVKEGILVIVYTCK